MATTPLFVQARKTTLLVGISAAENGTITLKNLVDIYGNPLAMSDFGAILYLTFDPGGGSEEIASLTDFTTNPDGSVDIDTGIVRGLMAKYPYSVGGLASSHAAGIAVVASNEPQFYQAIIDYINGIAVSGAPNANTTTKGILQVATAAQINAGTGTGSTGAALALTPDNFALSSYGINSPTTAQKSLLSAMVGVCFPFIGTTAPNGLVMVDGSALSNDTYPLLCGQALGYFGYGTGLVFTANASTDIITASSHGYTNGNRVLLDSTGTLPGGLSKHTIYFVITATTNTFQVATSLGGAAINITDTGTGTHGVYNQFRVPDMRGSTPVGAGTRSYARGYDSTIQTETDPHLGQVITAAITTISSVSGNTINTTAAHGLTTGDPVQFTGTVPAGISTGTLYFAVVSSTTALSLATSWLQATTYGNNVTLSGTTTGASVCPSGYFNAPENNPGWFATGNLVTLATSGSAPTGLSAGTYVAVILSQYPSRVYLADSKTDAYQFQPLILTSQGSGIQTLTVALNGYSLGKSGGEEVHRLTIAELASHNHPLTVGTSINSGYLSTYNGGQNPTTNTVDVQNTGGDQPHNNLGPYTVLAWITLAA